MVWTERLGQWVEAGTIKGLCPERLPAPPPLPPPLDKFARLRFIIPPSENVVGDIARTAAKAYLKVASYGLLGGKLLGKDFFKFYVKDRLMCEGPYKEGFDFETELPPDVYKLEVAHWKGNQELGRKAFDLDCSTAGDYEIRFNFVRGTFGGMSGSTIEILSAPGFKSHSYEEEDDRPRRRRPRDD